MSTQRYILGLLTSALLVSATLVGVAVVASAPASGSQPSDPGPANTLPSAVPSSITPQVDENPSGARAAVYGVAQVGSTLVIGGNFKSIGGQARNGLAAFNKNTGALSSFAPSIDGDVNSVLPGPTSTTIYIGGLFTHVNGAAAQFVAEIDFTTGALVSGFKAPAFNIGYVNDMVARGNRLYVAGTFTKVGGVSHGGLVSLNATTGALDPFVNVQFTGHHNDAGSGAQGWIGPWDIDVTRDGKTMAVIGNFKQANGLLRDQVALVDLSGASATIAPWATDRYAPYCFNWAFDGYVRGVSFSPDGSFFVVNATGGGNPGTLCDATARWETNLSDSSAQPTWSDETGGDTVWAVTVTDTAVFIGGHNRWNNNPLGVDQAQPGAVARAGMAALDPNSGRPFAWNPGKNPLGAATYAYLATTDGLWLGYDTNWIGNTKYHRQRIAFFPWAGGYSPAATTTANLPGTAYLGGSFSTAPSNVMYRVDAGGPAIQSLDSGPDWAADDSDPSPYRNDGSNAAGWGPGASQTANVPVTTPNAIFDSERWSPSDDPAMNWALPVPAGTHLAVRLYFANRYSGTSQPGQRVFNVALDGTTVLNNYDIVADVGDQTGTMKSFNITSDGTVNIDFSHVTENPLINGIEIVNLDAPTPPPGSTDGLSAVAFDGSHASGASVNNQGIDFGNWRGAFLVGKKVFYGYIDGFLYSRTFDGATFGPAVKIDPYHDPLWANVDTHDGTTFNGASPTLYSQLPNVTGMTYNGGRLYYTLFGDSHLYSRWFSPDSGIVDETTLTASSSVNFNGADGMFVAGGQLYYATKSDGVLHRVAFSNGTVSGAPTAVSGAGIDGVNWANRALFLASDNQSPSASFTSNCGGLSCSFNASASSDPDGSISSYAWTFGDTETGSGATPSHGYTGNGTYSVTLTVTDNQGATNSVSHSVTVSAATSAIRFVGAADSGGGKSVKSVTVTIPSAAAAGNTALMFFTQSTPDVWTGPTGVTGWTQIGTYANSTLTTTVWRKTLASGNPGATVTFNTNAFHHASLAVAVYSGVNTSNPIGSVAQSADTSSANHVSPTITAASGNWVLSFWADRSTATRTYAVPASVTTRDATPDSGSLTIQSVIGDSGGPVSVGGYGGITATTDAATSRSIAWTIALNSA